MTKHLTAKDYLEREGQLGSDRNYWIPQWQLVSEYIHQRRADFQTSRTPGAFINSLLWSDAPVHMAETSASAFLGYIWSAGVKSFTLEGNKKLFDKDKDMATFWKETTETLQEEMDEQEAGLSIALDESMLDLITLGTDAVFTEERNRDAPQLGCLGFQPWSIQEFALGEGSNGRATEFHRRKEYNTGQLIEKYGIGNVSAKVRKLFEEGRLTDKHQVLHVIAERPENERKEKSIAAKDMPYKSVHIEVEGKKILLNSGYQELPVACARLSKRIKEKYGRGRGMNALPTIMMLNQVMEDFMLAMEKNLDPPMYQIHDAVAGNGYIDTSAGANNILRIDKASPGVAPSGKLYDIQEIRNAPEVIEKLENNISNHFMIDRLINMNNDVEMTKGEAFLRNAIRQSTLRSIVSRMLLEKFDVIINTSFNICLRRNKFGYLPDDPEAQAKEANGEKVKYLPEKFIKAMEAEEDVYKIQYLTPAARDMMAEEGQGMVEMLEIAAQGAQFDETIQHRVDWEWSLNRLTEIKGADPRMWKKEAEVEAKVAETREAQKDAQSQEMMKTMGGVAKDAAVAQDKGQN